MSKERNDLKAGIFILVSIVLIIGVVLAIKGIGRFLEPMQHAGVRFSLSDDIGGLTPGDEVRVGGAKVGVVRSVDVIDQPENTHAIVISFSFPRRFILHKNAAIAVQSTVTGVSVLNFTDLGSGPVLAENEMLTGQPAALASLLASGPELQALLHEVRTKTVPKVNDSIDSAIAGITEYRQTAASANDLIKAFRVNVDPIVQRYFAVADTTRSAMQNASDLFGDTKADFRTTVANLSASTGTIKEKLPPLFDKIDGLLTSINTSVANADSALDDVKKIAANSREISSTARALLLTNRGKIDAMIASVKSTADNLKYASSEIRHNPWRLLYKPGPGEVANLNLYDSVRQFSEGANQLNEAATALRDALRDPEVKQPQVQQLLEKLDGSFNSFSGIEKQLWEQVKQ